MPDAIRAPTHLPGTEPVVGTRPAASGRTEALAAAATVAWLLVAGGLLIVRPAALFEGPLAGLLAVVFVLILPTALIWTAVGAGRTRRAAETEIRSLRTALDSVRMTQTADAPRVQLPDLPAAPPGGEALPRFASRRDLVPRTEPEPDPVTEAQPKLALGVAADDSTLPVAAGDLVRALQFPDSADDAEGIRALRAALADRETARLVRAAQDVLTLLGGDGIFMDDLHPERARIEIWRRFAQGERGRTVAALGGVRDRSSLALAAARMRQDTVFRDAAHHFLRHFDRMLAAFEPKASDQDLADLAGTRTSKAFMLLGRVTGIFD